MLDELASPELWRALSLVLMNLALAGLAGQALLRLREGSPRLLRFRRRSIVLYFFGLGLNVLATAAVFAGVPLSAAVPLVNVVLLETHSGALMWLELAGGLLMLAAHHRLPGRQIARVSGLLGFGLCVWGRAATGHGGLEGLLSFPVAIHAAHISAACGWAGLVLAWLWLGPDAAEEQPASLRQHLSGMALLCLTLVLVTGLADSLRMYALHARSEWLATPYGGILATKIGLVTAAAVLGGVNRFLVMPLIDRHPAATGRFYGVALAEGCLLLMVLMLAAQLANMPPG